MPEEVTPDPQQLEFLLSTPRLFGKLASIHFMDGWPHVTPLWTVYDPVTNRFIVSVGDTTVKAKNIKRDGRVALLIDSGEKYVLVRGIAKINEAGTAKSTEKLAVWFLGEVAGKREAARILQRKHVSIEIVPLWITSQL
jgi:Pyridoxamine 5'-phosphate oxidase